MKKRLSLIISLINTAIIIALSVFLIIKNSFVKERMLTGRDIFDMNINKIVEVKAIKADVGESYATGIFYSDDGLLVTNAHVISYKESGIKNLYDSFQIRSAKENDYRKANFVKIDYDLDLAVLKVDEHESYEKMSLQSKDYQNGDTVYSIGNTLNNGIGISKGIISVKEVNIKYDGLTRNVIQADINISSGNSGGALLNENGELIGITTFRIKDNTGNINYGFSYSIPVSKVKEFISN